MLRIENLSLERAGQPLFSRLNFSFNQTRYGLVGLNGVGKSTLAKILAGELEPDEGCVRGNERIFYVPQFEDRTRKQVTVKSRLLTAGGGEIDTLSGGEWMRLRLTDAFARDPDFLILDEPTNNLDHDAKEIVLMHLRSNRKGLIVISHDRNVLREVDEILELTPQGLKRYGGGFDLYWAERQRMRENAFSYLEDARKKKRKVDIKSREERDAQAKRNRRGDKHAKSGSLPRIVVGLRKRAAEVSRGKMESMWNERVKNSSQVLREAQDAILKDPFLRFDFEAETLPASKVIFMAEGLNVRFEAPLWKENLAFQMRARDRWYLSGGNGAGKSTLLKILTGQQKYEGQLTIASSKIVYLDQDQTVLPSSGSVLQVVSASTRFSPSQIRNELAYFGFAKDKVYQDVRSLSGGERLRAALAKVFLSQIIPQVLLLDEPTNNLDFASLELLETALRAYPGLLVVASHDQDFIDALDIDRHLKL